MTRLRFIKVKACYLACVRVPPSIVNKKKKDEWKNSPVTTVPCPYLLLKRQPAGLNLLFRDDLYPEAADEAGGENPEDVASLFPDPYSGLEGYLDSSKEDMRALLKRQFDDWWAKIQANKNMIQQHEFNKQVTLAEMKYKRRFLEK